MNTKRRNFLKTCLSIIPLSFFPFIKSKNNEKATDDTYNKIYLDKSASLFIYQKTQIDYINDYYNKGIISRKTYLMCLDDIEKDCQIKGNLMFYLTKEINV